MITAQFCKINNACYSDERLNVLFDRPMTIEEVLTRRDGPWAKVSDRDRIWVLTRPGVLNRQQLLTWLALLVERALGRIKNPDPRSVAVVEALRTDTVTESVRAAAYAATAYTAYATYVTAAYAATAANAAATYDAAVDAAVDAAAYAAAVANATNAAERKQQIEDALSVLR